MPHPTPVQILYGSATVVSSTLLLLLLAPGAPAPVVALIAVGSLAVGTAVAVLLRPRRTEPREPAMVPAARADQWEVFHSPAASAATAPTRADGVTPGPRAARHDGARPKIRV